MLLPLTGLGLLLLAAPPELPGHKLVWNEEFERDGLPDPAKWVYEEGFVRNREEQFYTRDRLENARVGRGELIITGRRERFRNPRFDPAAPKDAPWNRSREWADYTAASITTKGKASWLYGRIEVRAKLPHGKGVWPAIWMLGTTGGWPRCGEIDIMEFVGHTPDKTHATVHWSLEGKHKSNGKALTVSKPWEDFHVHAVEWTAERMEFYYDQTKVHSYDLKLADEKGENPFRKPQYLLINLALGGSWGKQIDDTILPQEYRVDYVRVYQKAPAG
jgi:hypothetical protein